MSKLRDHMEDHSRNKVLQRFAPSLGEVEKEAEGNFNFLACPSLGLFDAN